MVLSMERWLGKVAIVTGASSGIGAAIAEALVKKGMKVVGLARRKEKLDEIANKLSNCTGLFHPYVMDLTKEEEIIEACKWTKENVGPIHVLINNAGIMRPNGLINGETKSWKELMDVNVLALCIATREAIQDMKANQVDGHIIHINSIGGHVVPSFPHLNVYSGTKFAITALTETLRLELNSMNSKIKVSSISPGVVQTDLLEGCGIPREQYSEWYTQMAVLQPEDVADGVVYVLSTPPHVQVHELIIRANLEQ